MFSMMVMHNRMHNDEMKDFDYLRVLGMGVNSAREYMLRMEGWADCPQDFAPRGGETVVWVWDNDVLVGVGEARCSPLDSYNKKTGIRIALSKIFEMCPYVIEELADDDSASAFEIKRRFPEIFVC